MNSDAEKQLELNAEVHAAQFRRKHKVPMSEWLLAEVMTEDLQAKLLREFWEVYDRESQRDVGRAATPPRKARRKNAVQP